MPEQPVSKRNMKLQIGLCVGMVYMDKFTDVVFTLDLMRNGIPTSAAIAAFSIVFFSVYSGARSLQRGNGLAGFILAFTGLDLGIEAWHAFTGTMDDPQQFLRDLTVHFSTQSIVEGIPLVFLAFVSLYFESNPCFFGSCDAASIAAAFPANVHTLPPSARPLSTSDLVALQGDFCADLPLTADGWMTYRSSVAWDALQMHSREKRPFESVIEFPLHGITAENGTLVTPDYFSCIGWTFPDPVWFGLLHVPPFRGSWIPILSAMMGIIAAMYNLTHHFATDPSTSLWAVMPHAPPARAAEA
eukprot:jgi/Ulvmu1/1655/UM114_0024.1